MDIQRKPKFLGYKILKASYVLVSTSLIKRLGRVNAVILATLLIYEEFTKVNAAKLIDFLLGINIVSIRNSFKELDKLGYIKLLTPDSYKKVEVLEEGVRASRVVDGDIKQAKLPPLIPLFFELQKKLGTVEALLLGFISLYQNKNRRFYFSNQSIARALRISPSYASELVTKLVDLGYLERRVVKNEKTNQSIRFLSLTTKFKEAPDPKKAKDLVLIYKPLGSEKYDKELGRDKEGVIIPKDSPVRIKQCLWALLSRYERREMGTREKENSGILSVT